MANNKKERIGRPILACLIAALGPVCFGYCLGYSSAALVDLKSAKANSAIRLSDSQGSWFSSLVTVGAIFGGPVGGWSIDQFGRKGTILLCAVPFELGWLLIGLAKNRAMLYAGRIITGLALGVISLAVPVYIAEISPPRLRGMLGSVNQLAVTMGILLATVFGVFCNWKWLALAGGLFPALLVIFMVKMPETPRWCFGKNQRSEAVRYIHWLRGSDVDIEEECKAIESSLESHEKPSIREWLSPNLAKPLIISIGLMFFQQFCGINAVLFNAASIFAVAGFKDGKLVSISVGLVQFVGTALACLIMDRAGRRILLLVMAVGMVVTLAGLGLYFEIYIPPHGDKASSVALGSISHSVAASKISWLSILCIIVFFLCFSLAWGPVPWLVTSEIFPLRARGPACSVAAIANWLFAFIVTYFFENMQESLTIQGTYWFFGGCSFLAFVFVYLLMPETKGKSLEEIEALFGIDKSSYDVID